MSSFKTQTGPGTIYDQLLHPPTDSTNQELTHEDPAEGSPKAITANGADEEPEAPTGLGTAPYAYEGDTTALAPASRDPKS